MTEVIESISEKMNSEEKVTNGDVDKSETGDCARSCPLNKDEVEKTKLLNCVNGVGDNTDVSKDKDEVKPSERITNGESQVSVTNGLDGKETPKNDESTPVEEQVKPQLAVKSDDLSATKSTEEKVEIEDTATDQNESESEVSQKKVEQSESEPAKQTPVDQENAKKESASEEIVETVKDSENLEKAKLTEPEKPSSTEKTTDTPVPEAPKEDISESQVPKKEAPEITTESSKEESSTEPEPTKEVISAEPDPYVEEITKSSEKESVTQVSKEDTSIEKMEVDEIDGSDEKEVEKDKKNTILSSPCRVVLVKMDVETEEGLTKNNKRKRSTSSVEENAEPDDSQSPVKAAKKLKLDNAKKSEEGDQSPVKSDTDSRKSPRLSTKSKESKSDENSSPSPRKSSRTKTNQATPETEKSPSTRAKSTTPNSTPKKSTTPNKSKTKKEESNEESATPTSAKRERRSTAGKRRSFESEDEDEIVSKKSKTPKAKGGKAKPATKTVAKEAESEGEEEDAVEDTKSKSAKKGGSSSTNQIDKMKRLLSAANLRINNYSKFWKDCKTEEEKADRILQHLRENGLEGSPTIENCKLLRKKIETEKELAALDKKNILNTTDDENNRVTRSRRSTRRN